MEKRTDEVIEVLRSRVVASCDEDDPKKAVQYSMALAKLESANTESEDSKTKNRIAAATGLGGLILTAWGTLKALKFEQSGGIVTSLAGKNFLNAILKINKR